MSWDKGYSYRTLLALASGTGAQKPLCYNSTTRLSHSLSVALFFVEKNTDPSHLAVWKEPLIPFAAICLNKPSYMPAAVATLPTLR